VADAGELFKRYEELVGRVEDPSLRKQFVGIGRELRAAVEAGGGGEPATTSVRPLDLAKSFRDVIDTIQADARQADEIGVTIRALDVEIKGLVEATEKETTLVLPSAGATIDPNALSTVRVSFSAVPSVPAAEPPK
jgi:hypothetical protein